MASAVMCDRTGSGRRFNRCECLRAPTVASVAQERMIRGVKGKG